MASLKEKEAADMEKTIAVIRGDGIGPEIVGEAVDVLDTVAKKFGHTFCYIEAPMGGCAIDAFGVPLPDELAQTCLQPTVCCSARWAAPSGTPALGKPSRTGPAEAARRNEALYQYPPGPHVLRAVRRLPAAGGYRRPGHGLSSWCAS